MELPEQELIDEYLVGELIEPCASKDIALEKLYETIDEDIF